MSLNLLYIGEQKSVSDSFSSALKHPICYFKEFADCDCLCDFTESHTTILFYQKGEVTKNLKEIEFVRNSYPHFYFILVTDELTEQEAKLYHRAGIHDSVPYNVSKERLRNGVAFVLRNKKIISASKGTTEPLDVYVTPLWKRAMDLVIASLALIILAPFLLIIALLIRLESKGPVIYKSKRVGSNYLIFNFYKFRSMYSKSEELLGELEDLNQYSLLNARQNEYSHYSIYETLPLYLSDYKSLYLSDDEIIPEEIFKKRTMEAEEATFVKLENDPRVTTIGKFIRKFSIDELPQLLNVLKGEMSIVGNRPLPLYEAEKLTTDRFIERFLGPSGLTGLWQVEKRGDSGLLSPQERKLLDVYYANHYSFWLDIKIIIRTFTAFIQKGDV